MVMVALSTMLLRGSEDGWSPDGTADLAPRELLVPRLVATLAWVTALVGAVVLVLGTIVTGSGPHSGDAEQPARTGFDPRSVAWLHADVVMLFVGLVVAVPRGGVADQLVRPGQGARGEAVLVVTLLQGAIGYVAVLHRPARDPRRPPHARSVPARRDRDARRHEPARQPALEGVDQAVADLGGGRGQGALEGRAGQRSRERRPPGKGVRRRREQRDHRLPRHR